MRRNILVVDDDPQIQDLVKFFLEQAGFNIKICKNGYEALEELYNNNYDLIILDINMPLMNGYKTLIRIRATPSIKNIPVLMLSVNQNRDDVVRAQKYNIADYIIKPPIREDLLKRVERVLGGLPQFEEIQFTESDPLSLGSIKIQFFLKSISSNGMILIGDMFFKKLSTIVIQELELFKYLKIERTEYLVTECKPNEEGRYDYFISFLTSTQGDQKKIRDWVIAETFKRKNA